MNTVVSNLMHPCYSGPLWNTYNQSLEPLHSLSPSLTLPFLAAYGNLANVLAQRGRVEEAEVAFKRALRHRPNMADAHYNL